MTHATRLAGNANLFALFLAASLIAATGFPAQNHSPATPADTPQIHLARGLDDLNQSRYGEAEREFRAALALDPTLTVRARFPLAVTLFGLQERDEARKEFEAVRAQTGDDPNLNYYLGRLDMMDGQFKSAIHNLTIAATKPPFPDTDYYLGYAYMKERDFQSAEKWLKKAAELSPTDARIHERLGLLYRAMDRQAEAQKAFATASELHQQDVLANEQTLDCGRSLDMQPLDQARDVCRKLLDPKDLGKLVSLGTLYGQHKDYADAVEPFRFAAELDPDSYEMQYNLGLTYFRLRRYADARSPLEKAVALRPDMFEMNAPLGATLYALGDDAAAYRVLDRANRLNPAAKDIALLLSKSAMNLAAKTLAEHEPSEARRYLERAAEACPNDPEIHRRLAESYQSEGDHADAVRERELAERLKK